MSRLFGKHRPLDEELSDTPWTRRTILLLVIILVCFSGFLAIAYRTSRSGPYRPEYSGTLVEKWARYNETEQGAQPLFRLLLEDDKKARFVVAVDDNTYRRAEPGMKISKTDKGVVLLEVSTTTR